MNLYLPTETISFQDEIHSTADIFARTIINQIGKKFWLFSR